MIIYNVSKLNTGMGVYALNLSRYLGLSLVNEFLSEKHYYLDFIKRSLFKKRVNYTVINSSIFSNLIGNKNIFVIHDFFYKDYADYMSLIGRFTFDYALMNAKRYSDLFICVSNYTLNRASLELNKDKLEVIYPFINWNFNYNGDKRRDKVILLMDNTNYKNKRADYYQRFYEYVVISKYYNYFRFNKFGYPLKPLIMDFRVRNYQGVDENTVIKVYKESNVFLSFSENEGFGYPLIQSILSGNSVVVSQNETYKELLGNDFRYFIKDIGKPYFPVDSNSLFFDDVHDLIIQSLDDKEMQKSVYNKIIMEINPEILKRKWEYVFDKLGVKV